jgi:release factor glutamine methyltransferase
VELVKAWTVDRGQGTENASSVHGPRSTVHLPVVADIGTGSGAIAIALALEAPVSGVIATDVSADALNVALENAAMLGARERIGFRHGHLLDPLLDDRVDVVVSNPPYVATAEWEALDGSVKDYEPRLSLDGGADGLDPYRAIARQARESLTAGGLLALEIDARRGAATADIVRAAGFEQVTIRDDLSGRPRYLLARNPA